MNKCLAVAGVLALAACSKGGGSAAVAAQQPTASSNPQGSSQQRFPGATGEIAAIDGHTLQVQSTTEQTAVTWSAKTAFTDTVPTTFAAVAIGSCVVVRDATAAVRASATPDPSATRPSELTAASVAVSAPVDGACTGRRVGGAGGGLRGTPPPGLVRPSASPGFGRNGGRAGGFGGGAFGEVVSKSANGFVVTSELPPRQGTTPGTPATTAVTTRVTTTAGTTYTTDQKVTATALKVGECVTARGAADTAGTVAATTIAIRAKTEGTCSAGFGRPRG